jgi:hypothetical protein
MKVKLNELEQEYQGAFVEEDINIITNHALSWK